MGTGIKTDNFAMEKKSANKTAPVRDIYTGDNLPILRSMNSETVDLIYLDPPFNSGKQWANPIKAGGKKAKVEFKDTWTLDDIHADHEWQIMRDCPQAVSAIDSMADINGVSWRAYLIYMGVRLLEMRRILKPAGSVYYHCDPVMSHGVKILMDAIFGGGKTTSGGNFRNEIIWHYKNASRGKLQFAKAHDVILWYGKTDKAVFNQKDVLVPFESGMTEWRHSKGGQKGKKMPEGKTPDDVLVMPAINTMSKERTGYPTQKPLALLEKIIKASSNAGDLVLDPFCGCATTCVAAERLKRNWIGIDLSEEAAAIVIERMKKEVESPLADPEAKVRHLRKPPKRNDLMRTDDQILRPRLHHKQEGECNGCGDKLELRHLENDHVVDKNRGGQDEDVNIQLLCGNCNRIKGNRGMQYLLRRINERIRQKLNIETYERRLKKFDLGEKN